MAHPKHRRWVAWFCVVVLSGSATIRADAEDPAVTNAMAIAPWVEKALAGRADVVALGDSNQAYGGHGWDHAWTMALAERFGLYATGLLSPGENGGWGAGLGYSYQVAPPMPNTPFVTSHAPAEMDTFLSDGTGMAPLNYLYLPAGEVAGSAPNQGIRVDRWSPLDVSAQLRFRVVYGKFWPGDGEGSFQLAVRESDPPYALLAQGAEQVTVTYNHSAGLRWTRLDLYAGPRDKALNFRFAPKGNSIRGPFIAYLMRVENRDRPTGAALTTLYAFGGQSARDMAAALLAASDESLAMLLGEARSLQTSPRRVLVRINSGLNDVNETEPSLGPGQVSDGSSAEAFEDNIEAIARRMTEVWTSRGWDATELFFLISVSHPTGLGVDDRLDAYRRAADRFSKRWPRTAATHFERLTSPEEMIEQGWYQWSGLDRYHLTQAGFEALSRRELTAITPPPPPCPTDLNDDAATDVRDLVILLGDFGMSVPAHSGGDVNGDGAVNTLDLIEMLGFFGLACGVTP